MKKPLYIFFLLILIYILGCDNQAFRNNAEIYFLKTEKDFGELEFNSKAELGFEFYNPENTPLIIYNVRTSCGCTVPLWPKKPIRKGERSEIQIKYNTTHSGVFRKTITVYFNGKDSPKTITIKGRVSQPLDFVEKKKSS